MSRNVILDLRIRFLLTKAKKIKIRGKKMQTVILLYNTKGIFVRLKDGCLYPTFQMENEQLNEKNKEKEGDEKLKKTIQEFLWLAELFRSDKNFRFIYVFKKTFDEYDGKNVLFLSYRNIIESGLKLNNSLKSAFEKAPSFIL